MQKLLFVFFAFMLLVVPQSAWSEEGGNIAENINLSGAIEVEMGFGEDMDVDSSDIALATVELGVDVKISDKVEGNVLFLYEEDDTEFDVDEGTVTIALANKMSLTAGKMYIPFGMFNSHFISDPLTLELGETNETAVMISRSSDLYEFSIGVFNGDVREATDDDEIDDIVASLVVTPSENFSIGVSYISDIADSDSGWQDITAPLNPVDLETVDDIVAGVSAFISATAGPVTLEAEYVGALDEFTAADVLKIDMLTGDKPTAYNLELAYAVNEKTEVAARFEGSDDLDNVEDQFGVVVSHECYDNTTFALEYISGDYKGGGDRSMITAQLAVEF